MVTGQHILCAATLLATASAVFGQLVPTQRRAGGLAGGEATQAAPGSTVQDVLRKPVGQVDWDEAPIRDVFQWLRDQGVESVVPVWRALRDERIGPDAPLSLTMTNTTVGQVLAEALDQLSDEVRWRAIGNVLRISTRRDFEKDLYTKAYDLAANTLDMPDFLLLPYSRFCVAMKEEATYTREERLERIRDIIVRTIAPDSWMENGGEGSIEIAYEANKIVIRNTPEVHVMIDSDFRLEDAIPTPSPRPDQRRKSESQPPTK